MSKIKWLAVFLSAILLLPFAFAQSTRDPLTDKESDDLREAAQEPLKRIKLLVKFASERLDTVENIQDEAKSEERGARMHDSLDDFRQIIDELDDNLDDYSRKNSDLRKALNDVIEAESQFLSRLQAIKKNAEQPAMADPAKAYQFVLDDSLEAVSLSLDDAKKSLDEQNEAWAKKKK